jgi:hypothetical protein
VNFPNITILLCSILVHFHDAFSRLERLDALERSRIARATTEAGTEPLDLDSSVKSYRLD